MTGRYLPSGSGKDKKPKWARGRDGKQQFPILKITFAIMALAACGIIVFLVLQTTALAGGILGGVGNLLSGIASFFGGIFVGGPTPTPAVTMGPPVIHYINRLDLLRTASYHIEVVVAAEQGGQGPLGLFSDRMLFVAVGNVTAGVNMGLMEQDSMELSPLTGKAHIVIPQAQLFDCFLDVDNSYVYDRDSGVLGIDLGMGYNEELETEVRRMARDRIREAALEDGILETAQEEAVRFVEQLMWGLGYDEVTVEISQEEPPPLRGSTCYPESPTPTPSPSPSPS